MTVRKQDCRRYCWFWVVLAYKFEALGSALERKLKLVDMDMDMNLV